MTIDWAALRADATELEFGAVASISRNSRTRSAKRGASLPPDGPTGAGRAVGGAAVGTV